MKKLLLTFSLIFGLLAPASSTPRIIGGIPATLGEFPFAVTIQLSGSHICGGLIYNERWILTTTSCVEGITELRLLEVIVADLNFLDDFEVDQQSYPVGQIVLAPELDGKAGQDDLALIEVTRPITFGDNVNCVSIAEPEPTGSPIGVLIGYGASTAGGLASTRLRKGDVTLNGDCTTWGTNFREAYMICAGSPSDVNKPCDFDFGSPLVQDGLAVGVLSQQIGCQSSPFQSSIYTRLASYFNWIRQEANTQPNTCFRTTTTTVSTTPVSTTTTSTTIESTTTTPTTTDSTTSPTTTEPTTVLMTTTPSTGLPFSLPWKRQTPPSTTTDDLVVRDCQSVPAFSCEDKADGYYPIATDLCCERFYLCQMEQEFPQNCPGGSVFDPIAYLCTFDCSLL